MSPGHRAVRRVSRLELGDDPGEALGERVVDLPGHPLPLVDHARLPGLGQQLHLQPGVLLQRLGEAPVGLFQLGDHLPAARGLLRGQCPEVGEPAGQHRVDHDEPEQRQQGRPGQVHEPAADLRVRDQRHGHADAGEPPPPAQVAERMDVRGEGVEAVERRLEHQRRQQQHQQPGDVHRTGPRVARADREPGGEDVRPGGRDRHQPPVTNQPLPLPARQPAERGIALAGQPPLLEQLGGSAGSR